MSLKLRMSRTHHYIQQPSGCVTTEDTTESCKRGRCFITNECPPTGPSLFGGPCFHIIHTRNPCQADKNISGCCSSLCAARAHVPPSLLWWLRADLWGSPPFRPCLFRLGLKVCAMLVCVYAGGGVVCVARLLSGCHLHFHTLLLWPSLAQINPPLSTTMALHYCVVPNETLFWSTSVHGRSVWRLCIHFRPQDGECEQILQQENTDTQSISIFFFCNVIGVSLKAGV